MTLSPRLMMVAVAATLVLALPSAALADEILARGSFQGASGHQTSGTTAVMQGADGTTLVLEADFKFDGAPDPKVGFGTGGKYDPASQLAHLQSKTGAQSYAVPAGLDVSGYDEVYIWCEKYNVPLGVARLQ